MGTPFENAGYTKDTKFKVLTNPVGGEFRAGDVVWLKSDDGSHCPIFTNGNGADTYLCLPTTGHQYLEVIPKVPQEPKSSVDISHLKKWPKLHKRASSLIEKYPSESTLSAAAGNDFIRDECCPDTWEGLEFWRLIDMGYFAAAFNLQPTLFEGVHTVDVVEDKDCTHTKPLSLEARIIVSQLDLYKGGVTVPTFEGLSFEEVNRLIKNLNDYYDSKGKKVEALITDAGINLRVINN